MTLQKSTAWTLLTLFLACCSYCIVASQDCGNGIVEGMEVCDDNNTLDEDGCNATCGVEDHFVCSPTSPSVCVAILLDLNVNDTTTLNRSLEYYAINTPVFLVDETMLAFFVRPAMNWSYLDIVILEDSPTIAERVGLDFGAITSPPRPFMQNIHSSDYPDGVIGRNVSSGTRVLVEDSVPSLTPDDLRTILHSVMYQANEEPGFSPRDVCLIAQDPVYDTTACVTLYYIGTNSNPPTITYDAEGVAIFVEGQSAPMRIVEGSITVDDPDHPTRFLIESASASIEGFTEGDAEWLLLSTSYIIPTGVSAAFDNATGTLIITGNATTDIYSALLEQLTYFNYMTEPEVFTRSVRVTIDDGLHTSSPATITINIMNTNDNPFVSLNGDIPVIMEYSTSYTEGSGAVVIVPNLHVVDSDPSPLIVRATVTLTDPVDGDDEVLGVIDKMGLNLTSSQHSLELTGAESPAVYTAALRTLTYHHVSASPGNPSTQPRTIEFTVEDSHNTTSTTSYLKLVINPVNDAPIISFGSGGSQEIYSYIEDDPAISIGRNITLADIDSPIMSVTLYLTNLLDGLRDSIGYDAALLEAYSLNVTIMDNGTSREIMFEGMASDSSYTEILRSLTYTNLHTNNSVTDGQRFITISATDTGARLSMDTLTLLINVAERNDGPAINLGDGIDAGFTVTYTEGGPSVGIGLSHLIHVMDEEGHSISSMVIKLVSTNNALDEGDLLFIRTPMLLHFFSDPNTNIAKRRISISLPGNSSDYIAALQAVRYINTEEEPTLFVNGSKLVREIVIRITDSTTEPAPTTNEVRVTVEIEPINDNAPRIIINSDPVCTEDFRDSGGTEAVSRRSVTPVTRGTHWRRRRSTTHRDNTDNVAAPQVLSIMSSFINSSCLSEMVVVFAMDTNAPVVEVQQELDTLVTFAPASLAKTQHYGYWRDYRTLVIVFRECVKWEREQYSKKPLYVVFYGQEGFCDWDSPCNKGVCYYNSTGCPVVGYHPASTSTHDNHTDPDEPVTPTALQGVDRLLFTVLLAVLLVAVATVLACECRQRKAVWYKQPGNDNCSSEEIKHVVPSHVIDITVPVVTTTATKSPPSPLTETKPATGEIQKVLLLEKDEHLPPPFLQAQGTNLVFLPATNTNIPAKVGEILPRKLPPPERALLQGVQGSAKKKRAKRNCGGVNPTIGMEEGEIHYFIDMVEGEGRETGQDEGVGEGDVLRGNGGYTPVIDDEVATPDTLQASSHSGGSNVEDCRQARERGGVARVQGYLDGSSQSREHSKHTHQYNDSTRHPH